MQCIDQRLRPRASCDQPVRRRLAAHLCLDGIEGSNAAQGFVRQRSVLRLRHFEELAPRVRPTGSEHDVALGRQPLEPGIAIDVKHALEPREVRLRPFSLAVWSVDKDSSRRIRPAPASLLAGIDPQPPRLRATAPRIEHRNRRVVGEQIIGDEHLIAEPAVQRFQPPGRAADPAGERRALQIDAMPGEDFRLPVEGQVIAVLGNQHLGEEARRREASGDRPFGRRRLGYALT